LLNSSLYSTSVYSFSNCATFVSVLFNYNTCQETPEVGSWKYWISLYNSNPNSFNQHLLLTTIYQQSVLKFTPPPISHLFRRSQYNFPKRLAHQNFECIPCLSRRYHIFT
jgi:hypothetical protein